MKRDWSKLDFDKLDKDWELGDEEEELKTEEQVMFDHLERKKQMVQNTRFDPRSIEKLSSKGVAMLAAGQNDMDTPTMMFAKVEGKGDVGSDSPTKEETTDIGSYLQKV
ncbi:unnamed protein product, partial [Choristocarpus tenellus]